MIVNPHWFSPQLHQRTRWSKGPIKILILFHATVCEGMCLPYGQAHHKMPRPSCVLSTATTLIYARSWNCLRCCHQTCSPVAGNYPTRPSFKVLSLKPKYLIMVMPKTRIWKWAAFPPTVITRSKDRMADKSSWQQYSSKNGQHLSLFYLKIAKVKWERKKPFPLLLPQKFRG